MDYLTVKWLHILSSTLLFGTGLGTAFYLFLATLTKNPLIVATVAKHVVTADWLFTATTIIIQPVTGFYLIHLAEIPLASRWIAWSIGLYVLMAACWLPVVWLQIRMQRLAAEANEEKRILPVLYWRYFYLWIAFGIPALVSILIIFYLMVAKPI
jgi:uncharacterized membrane protein